MFITRLLFYLLTYSRRTPEERLPRENKDLLKATSEPPKLKPICQDLLMLLMINKETSEISRPKKVTLEVLFLRNMEPLMKRTSSSMIILRKIAQSDQINKIVNIFENLTY